MSTLAHVTVTELPWILSILAIGVVVGCVVSIRGRREPARRRRHSAGRRAA